MTFIDTPKAKKCKYVLPLIQREALVVAWILPPKCNNHPKRGGQWLKTWDFKFEISNLNLESGEEGFKEKKGFKEMRGLSPLV